MQAKKCDRCGTLYENVTTPDLQVNEYRHPYGYNRYDLCPKCLNELENWLNGGIKNDRQ